jgi:hypothetical protein
MTQIDGWLIEFICLLGLTAFCSYLGYDDVVYDFFDRKPTPREGFLRLFWVVLKAVTSVLGGGLLAIFLFTMTFRFFPAAIGVFREHLGFSKNGIVLLAFALSGLMVLLIGILQNVIRQFRGRPTRPLVDWAILRKNLRQWQGKDWR